MITADPPRWCPTLPVALLGAGPDGSTRVRVGRREISVPAGVDPSRAAIAEAAARAARRGTAVRVVAAGHRHGRGTGDPP